MTHVCQKKKKKVAKTEGISGGRRQALTSPDLIYPALKQYIRIGIQMRLGKPKRVYNTDNALALENHARVTVTTSRR